MTTTESSWLELEKWTKELKSHEELLRTDWKLKWETWACNKSRNLFITITNIEKSLLIDFQI